MNRIRISVMSPGKIRLLLVVVLLTAPSMSCIGPCKRLFKRGAPCGTTVQQPATLSSPVAVNTPQAAPVAAAPVVAAPVAAVPMAAAPMAAAPVMVVPTAPMAYCCPPPTGCCPPPCYSQPCPPVSCCPSESYGSWDSGCSSGCNDCGTTGGGYYEQGSYVDPNASSIIPEGAILQGPGFVPQAPPQGQAVTPQAVSPQAPIQSGSGTRYPAPGPEGN